MQTAETIDATNETAKFQPKLEAYSNLLRNHLGSVPRHTKIETCCEGTRVCLTVSMSKYLCFSTYFLNRTEEACRKEIDPRIIGITIIYSESKDTIDFSVYFPAN